MSNKDTELFLQQIKILERLTVSSEYQTKTLDKILEFFNNGFKDEIVRGFRECIDKQNKFMIDSFKEQTKKTKELSTTINWLRYTSWGIIGTLIGIIISLIVVMFS